ncbi:MAG: oligosaccharide flippase family protein, partial [Phaeodactylibacter sp.]|nr:oligosaccharide flippase family protein [Phaeodactylibacter sp.]
MAAPSGKETQELKTRAVQGVRWTSLGSGLSVLFQLLQMILLARLLSPDIFGLMAMVLVVIRICNPIVDAGLHQAVIYKQDLGRRDLSTLYWINILLGILVFLLINSLRGPVAYFFQEPELPRYIFWTSLVFLIAPWGQQFQGLLSRDLHFDKLAIFQI